MSIARQSDTAPQRRGTLMSKPGMNTDNQKHGGIVFTLGLFQIRSIPVEPVPADTDVGRELATDFVAQPQAHCIKFEELNMPYKNPADLPDRVKTNLPKHAQEIYLSAFNNAWEQYRDAKDRRGDNSQEETAHRVAWAAVKQQYKKVGDAWQRKDQ